MSALLALIRTSPIGNLLMVGLMTSALAVGIANPSASGLLAGMTIIAAAVVAARVLTLVSGCPATRIAVDGARYQARSRTTPAPQHPRTPGRPQTRAPAVEAPTT